MSQRSTRSASMPKHNASITDYFSRTTSNSTQGAARPTHSTTSGGSCQPAGKCDSTFPQLCSTSSNHEQVPIRGVSSQSENIPISTNTTPTQSFSASQGATSSRVIASSDGEETDDESDDDGIHAIFGVKKELAPQTRPSTQQQISDPAPSTVRSQNRPLSRRKPVKHASKPIKFSMDVLLEEARISNSIAENHRKAEEAVAAMHAKDEAKLTLCDTDISDQLINEAMHGDGTMLKKALSRQEDFGLEDCYEFFGAESPSANSNPRFPTVIDENDIFFGTDEYMREDMFLSGFVYDVALTSDTRISHDVLMWMLEGVCTEYRSDLWSTYVRVLEVLPNERIHPLLTCGNVARMFTMLGAKDECLNLESQIKLRGIPNIARPEGDFGKVKQVVHLLANKIDPSDDAVISALCGFLIRSILDVRISRHSDVVASLEHALAIIMNSILDEEWERKSDAISNTIISTIIRPQDRRTVLEKLPIHTSELHLFRRRLALSFLFEDGSYIRRPYEDLVELGRFTRLFHQSLFCIQQIRGNDKSTDYNQLESLLSIMDIALDKGDTTQATLKEKDLKADHFQEILRSIEAGINDSRGDNIMRTRTKELLDRLKYRVAFTVRSTYKSGMESAQQTLEASGFGRRA